ncbi:MAG: hypothetical protein R2849_14310 [Thermomicrobiales bacterium]
MTTASPSAGQASSSTTTPACEPGELLKSAPEPVGFDPAIVPAWSDGPTSDAFAAMRLDPWRLRVFPGTVLMGEGGEVLEWQAEGK